MVATALSSGANTPKSELDGFLVVHPTSVRRPEALVVHSENTNYTDEHITSRFFNRGASAVPTGDGRFEVTPTVQEVQFQTERKVPKTG